MRKRINGLAVKAVYLRCDGDIIQYNIILRILCLSEVD